MGKKSKKNKAEACDLQPSNEGKQELEDNIDSVKKSKKKSRKRNLDATTEEELPVNIKEEDNIASDPTATKIKKEKKKKHKLKEQELCEEVQNADTLSEDQPPISKKKKKASKIIDKEDDTAIDTTPVSTEENTDSKKKKNKSGSLNNEKGPKAQNEDLKQSKKKSGKNAKTGAPVLNDEEAQVTEEDIDRFIDELDEEDNKQYEDWVKLLDARLNKKQRTE